MRYSLKFLLPLMILASSGVGLARTYSYANVGRTPSQEEIRSLGVIVSPDGKDLPLERGTAQEGAELYAKQCAADAIAVNSSSALRTSS